MKRSMRAFGFLAALSLSTLAVQAQPSNWSFVGCWYYTPDCPYSSAIWIDSSGQYWNCGYCDRPVLVGPSSCIPISNSVESIGYWCE